jgi:D-alanine--poly(phosphoribitol) ligase subunit 2
MSDSVASEGRRAPVDGDDATGEPSQLDAVVADVHALLTDHLLIDAPTPDTDIVDSGALDSFTMVELLVTLEERFGAEIPIEDLDVEHFRTARSIALLVVSSPTS